jgi:hypothetical protein
MAEARVERRLAAILAVDVAGYSRAALEAAQVDRVTTSFMTGQALIDIAIPVIGALSLQETNATVSRRVSPLRTRHERASRKSCGDYGCGQWVWS